MPQQRVARNGRSPPTPRHKASSPPVFARRSPADVREQPTPTPGTACCARYQHENRHPAPAPISRRAQTVHQGHDGRRACRVRSRAYSSSKKVYAVCPALQLSQQRATDITPAQKASPAPCNTRAALDGGSLEPHRDGVVAHGPCSRWR